jgi:hypothetical protein
VAIVVVCSGCTILEWAGGSTRARLEDTRVKPYLDAASRSNRVTLGFSPLPATGDVRVEVPRFKTHYDVMLHIDGARISRTVDFLLVNGQPVWSGEQETHRSGRTFESVDGEIPEQLVLSYSTVQGSGTPLGGYVSYWGPDEKLTERSRAPLSPQEARQIWTAWPQ